MELGKAYIICSECGQETDNGTWVEGEFFIKKLVCPECLFKNVSFVNVDFKEWKKSHRNKTST